MVVRPPLKRPHTSWAPPCKEMPAGLRRPAAAATPAAAARVLRAADSSAPRAGPSPSPPGRLAPRAACGSSQPGLRPPSPESPGRPPHSPAPAAASRWVPPSCRNPSRKAAHLPCRRPPAPSSRGAAQRAGEHFRRGGGRVRRAAAARAPPRGGCGSPGGRWGLGPDAWVGIRRCRLVIAQRSLALLWENGVPCSASILAPFLLTCFLLT